MPCSVRYLERANRGVFRLECGLRGLSRGELDQVLTGALVELVDQIFAHLQQHQIDLVAISGLNASTRNAEMEDVDSVVTSTRLW